MNKSVHFLFASFDVLNHGGASESCDTSQRVDKIVASLEKSWTRRLTSN